MAAAPFHAHQEAPFRLDDALRAGSRFRNIAPSPSVRPIAMTELSPRCLPSVQLTPPDSLTSSGCSEARKVPPRITQLKPSCSSVATCSTSSTRGSSGPASRCDSTSSASSSQPGFLPSPRAQLGLQPSPRAGGRNIFGRAHAACKSGSSTTLLRECPVCFGEVRASDMETLGCGTHQLCEECARQSVRLQVRSGQIPRCMQPQCRAEIEPLVAQRLLSGRDFDLYLQMTLWCNPQVEACPKCSSMFFADYKPGCDRSSCGCPSCGFVFCLNCRCTVHPEMSCDDALEKHQSLASSAPVLATSEVLLGASKVCPRCRSAVEKADAESCDHVTCARCRHEFCWACMADRQVIYAHGNHLHWRHCRFYAPFSGPAEYLPRHCPRCRLLGKACRQTHASTERSVLGLLLTGSWEALLDTGAQWFGGNFLCRPCAGPPPAEIILH